MNVGEIDVSELTEAAVSHQLRGLRQMRLVGVVKRSKSITLWMRLWQNFTAWSRSRAQGKLIEKS